MPRDYRRAVEMVDYSYQEIAIARAEHDRMRSLGISVVRYEVGFGHDPSTACLHAEFVQGVRLPDLPPALRRRELKGLAMGLHAYYTDVSVGNTQHTLADITSTFQYMYGVTASQPDLPQTYLVDVEPRITPLQYVGTPTSWCDFEFNNDIALLASWAKPFWDAISPADAFPYRIYSEEELSEQQKQLQ